MSKTKKEEEEEEAEEQRGRKIDDRRHPMVTICVNNRVFKCANNRAINL